MTRKNNPPLFRKNPLALWAAVALLPATHAMAQQLDLVQGPPSSKSSSYVRPNVLLSLDDSGSMQSGLNGHSGKRRVDLLRDALQDTFSNPDLDGQIRLAWHTMNSRDPVYHRLKPNSTAENAMRVFTGQHRDNFLRAAARLPADGWTPTHGLVAAADAYFRDSALSKDSPWASEPGVTDKPFLGCRRNYHILLTDGEWNMEQDTHTSPSNIDGTATTLPDGKQYTAAGPYGDDDRESTIADWAFYSWAVPLKDASSLDGDMKPDAEYNAAPAQETFTSLRGGTATLEKYWNPKYNPATWPHLVTFTIGVSREAVYHWGPRSEPSSLLPYGYDGIFADIVNGTTKWTARHAPTQDMWHAAINGRGEFYSVQRPEDLRLAFEKIIQKINTTTAGSGRGRVAASGSSRVRSDVGIFETFYDAGENWKGGVEAQTLKKDGTYEPGWGGQSTADLLDAAYPTSADGRTIVTTSSRDPLTGQGIPFRFASLSDTQKGELNNSEELLNYLRGNRDKEDSFRTRSSIQGDIVNSNVWYTQGAVSNYNFPDYTSGKYLEFARTQLGRSPMIYVGGNDGMLHGFDAASGEEKIAYVPNAVYAHLKDLGTAGYDHHYYVDGTSMSGDIRDGTEWKTLLVGTLGAGGKGYYVLDVTDPGQFSESNAKKLVVLDATFAENFECRVSCVHDDIGHIFADPSVDATNPLRALQIARLNDGRWAAILGNGLNSKNGNSVLLIQYLDGNKELLRIPASASAGKTGGLGGPMPVDINGDGRPDVVYAGDNDGQLWKFDISSPDPGSWKVAFGGQALFSATPTGSTGPSAHPISAAPLVRPAPGSVPDPQNPANIIKLGGMMVAFGTGRNVTADDRTDTTVQAIYSVLDNTRYKAKPHPKPELGYHVEICTSTSDPDCGITPEQVPAIVGKAQLARQSFGAATQGRGADYQGVDKSVRVDWRRQRGWYVELPEDGERLLRPIRAYENSDILSIFTQVPQQGGGGSTQQDESCDPQPAAPLTPGKQFQSMLHIATAQPARQPLFDVNGDGIYHVVDEAPYARRTIEGSDLVLIRGTDSVQAVPPDFSTTPPTSSPPMNLLPSAPVRPSWRQVR